MRGHAFIGSAAFLLLTSCGGGSSDPSSDPPALTSGPGPPAYSSVPLVQVSQPATFGACSGVAQPGTLYSGTALGPSLVVNPTNTANLIAAWQQESWSNGGAQALNLGASSDGGMTWTVTSADFSVCTGGLPSNTGNYLRAGSGWLTVSTSGLVFALSASFSGGALQAGSSSAQLVASSINGGFTWGVPIALITDGPSAFDDNGSITADPINPSFVYAVWDRLTSATVGQTYFAVTADTGFSWQPATRIYDPGANNQTLGNTIVVIPGDILVDIFTEIDTSGSTSTALLRAISSTNNGTSWSAPVTIATNEAVGTVDPQTGAPIHDSADLFSATVSPTGTLYVVWQDSRFSNGQIDGIALSSSTDGGQSWSKPLQVNAVTTAAAFTPTVQVIAGGVIGVTYYDLRNDTMPGSILSDYWLVTSSDATNFTETHLSGPFNVQLAPSTEFGPQNTPGYFLGDHQALVSTGTAFLPVYTQTNAGSAVSTDVFIASVAATAGAAAAQSLPQRAAKSFRAVAAPQDLALTGAARQRVMERVRLTQAARLRGR